VAPVAPRIPQKLAQFIGKVEGIRFAPNQPVLLAQSFPVLDKVAEALQESPTVQLEVSGHTDNVGVPAENQTLSQQRAEAVKKYLEGKGVLPKRLIAVGFGASRPVADNATDVGRAQNRRVELRVLPGAPVAPVVKPPVAPAPPEPGIVAPVAPPSIPVPPSEANPAIPAPPAPPALPTAPEAPSAPPLPVDPNAAGTIAPVPPAAPSPPAVPVAPAPPVAPPSVALPQ
jgi:hypothetical protein